MNSFILGMLVYVFVFNAPVILYLKYKDKVNPFEFLKLNKNIKKGLTTGLLISFLFVAALVIKNFILGFESVNFNIGLLWIVGLLVGLFEEIPFRGFIFQKLSKRMSFMIANIITTILFVSIHLPVWIYTNANLASSIPSVFVVSLILGYLFEEYDSLWVPILCHAVFNLCIWTRLG